MKLFKVILVIILSVGLLPSTSDAATKTLKVHFINVGQGDATYIKMPGGEDVLIDGGDKGKGMRLLLF